MPCDKVRLSVHACEVCVKKLIFAVFFPLIAVFSLFSQEIITADKYLESVSERYASIKDYEARVFIRSDSTDMIGNLSFLDPYFLRIDFTDPPEQVLVFTAKF